MEKDIFVTAVEGNRQMLDGGSMFGNAPRPLWERWVQPDELGRIPLACRSMLVQVDGLNILCEVGIGNFFDPSLADRYGVQDPTTHRLVEELAKSGLQETDIDFVILSHLHFDHAGGLLQGYGEQPRLRFPKAKYVVGKGSWERACQPHFRDRASFISNLNTMLSESGRLLVVEGERCSELPDCFSFFTSEGHTPGQMHTVVTGASQKGGGVIFAGDLIPGLPWVHLPITMGYDRYPERIIDEKQACYKRYIGKDWLYFFTHDAAVEAAWVEKNEKGKYVGHPTPPLRRTRI